MQRLWWSLRSVAFFLWMAITVVPWASAVVLVSIFVRGDRIYWMCAGWLTMSISSARVICGVRHRMHGLDNLAQAMKGERLKDMKFKVEGHTDAQGSASLNDKLSLDRAQAVVKFMQQNEISPDRLVAEGKGFSELLMPDKPQAMENRRVRITTLP